MVLDRALGFLGLLLVAAAFGIYLMLRAPNREVAWIVAVFVAPIVATVLLAGAVCGFTPVLGLRRIRRFRYLARFVDAFAIYRERRHTLGAAILISVLAHLLTCVASCLSLVVLGKPFSWPAIMAVTPLVIVARFLPIVPLGLGVSDTAAELLYRMSGVDAGAESQMMMRAAFLALTLLSGLAFLVPVVRRDGG